MLIVGSAYICGLVIGTADEHLKSRYRDAISEFSERYSLRIANTVGTSSVTLNELSFYDQANLFAKKTDLSLRTVWSGVMLKAAEKTALPEEGHYSAATLDSDDAVVLTRDIAGVSKLYFTRLDNAFFFSSSLELLALFKQETAVHAGALHHLMHHGLCLGEQTLYRDVFSLSDQTLKITCHDGKIGMEAQPIAQAPAAQTSADTVLVNLSAYKNLQTSSPSQENIRILDASNIHAGMKQADDFGAFFRLPEIVRSHGQPLDQYWEQLFAPHIINANHRCFVVNMGQALVDDTDNDIFVNGPSTEQTQVVRAARTRLINALVKKPFLTSEMTSDVPHEIKQDLLALLGKIPTRQEIEAFIAIKYHLPSIASRLFAFGRLHGVIIFFPWLTELNTCFRPDNAIAIQRILSRYQHLRTPDMSRSFSYSDPSAVNLYDSVQRLFGNGNSNTPLNQLFNFSPAQTRHFISGRDDRNKSGETAFALLFLTFDYLTHLFNCQTTH